MAENPCEFNMGLSSFSRRIKRGIEFIVQNSEIQANKLLG